MKKLIITLITAAIAFSAFAQNSNKTQNGMKEVQDFIRKCGYYFLATVDGEQPRVRPFGTVATFGGKLYIQTGKRKNVAKQMLDNPKIEICAYDTESGAWLRVEAIATPDERREAKQFMLDEYPSLKGMYSADDDNTFVLALSEVMATFYTFAGEQRVVKF